MRSPVLDPLWITKGISEFDSEYYKYIILSANKRWRDNLNSGDYSNFYENIHIPNTILVHRKKQTNTLYTINALNEVIKYLNRGVLDTSYKIPWENYRNCLLLTKELGFKKIRTNLKAIKEIT